MENDILDALDDLGYTGPGGGDEELSKATEGGPSSTAFTQLVEWLVQHIGDLCGLDERVHAIRDSSESSNFLLEVSGFLREYGCPYPDLTEGPVNDRLNSSKKCLQLLDFLTGELEAVRMLGKKKPALLQPGSTETTSTPAAESEMACCMKTMMLSLGFPKPPHDITAEQLFTKLESKMKELIAQHPDQISKPLLKGNLSEEQWEKLTEISEAMEQDYHTRKEMLLKRLDVTIQSFATSEKAKKSQDSIARAYQPIRQALRNHSQIGLPHILAAREDLTRIQKTSTGDSRKECAINKVMIGRVPDRGGRAWELEPPPPEMPFFMKRSNAPQGRGRGGYRGGGNFRGGRGGGDNHGRGGGGGGHHRGGGRNRGQGGYNRGGW
ncbi:hypothetical protein ACOMHN_042648 [Nucella lapillus]